MDGRNSIGRRISLLNENETPRAANNLSSVVHSSHSRPSSVASTPSLSPQTPQLIRSDSTDSCAMRTPSPITPNFSFEGLPSQQQQQQTSPIFGAVSAPFFPPSKDNASVYPPLPQQVSAWAYPHASAPQQPAVFRTSQSPTSDRRPSSSSKQSAKKNQYPCPMAKQFNCHDFFTTSGHAARHAKKHTGKKDAFCPECNKAFTRKDNMEQHRRTHQNGRNASKGSAEPGAKSKKSQSKRSKPAPLQAATMPAVDPMLPVSPASSFGFPERSLAPVVPAMQAYGQDFLQRLQYGEPISSAPYPLAAIGSAYNPISPTFTTALDTLAIAATSTGDGLKRKAED